MTDYKKLTEDGLEVLHLIEKDPKISQRRLSAISGFSLGKVNYCLKALIDIGFIKIHNFTNSSNKFNYIYIITPKGMKEKITITRQFIDKKQAEYDKLTSYLGEK